MLLLCVPCHELALAGAHALKRRLAAEFDAPLDVDSRWRSGKLVVNGGDPGAAAAARTAAVTLARHGEKMPRERREELERVVWEAIKSEGEGEEEGNGGGSGGDRNEKEEQGKALAAPSPPPPPPLPPKEILAAKLVAASSPEGLIRRDAHRLCKALGVTLQRGGGGDDDDDEGEEEEGEEGEGEGGAGAGSRPSRRLGRPQRSPASPPPPPLLSSLPGRRTGGGHRAHGLAVVRALASSSSFSSPSAEGFDEGENKKDQGGGGGTEPALDELAARFRRVFVAAVAPRFLPPGWAVDAPLGRRAHGPYSAVVKAEQEARERSAAEAAQRRRSREGKKREEVEVEAEVEEVAAFAF